MEDFGSDELECGILKRWRCVHSSEGGSVWKETSWESSDAHDFKQLGASKQGEDPEGNRWHEEWQETLASERGIRRLERTTEKWSTDATRKEWREQWFERFFSDGRCERGADKTGQLPPGAIAEDGHGDKWHERWGETWEADGAGLVKWTDKWASRVEREGGGPGRSWGDKWEDRHGSMAPGGLHARRVGECWSEGGGVERYSRTWSEDYTSTTSTGWCHKAGGSTGGEHWDTEEDSDLSLLIVECERPCGFDEALRRNCQLVSVAARHTHRPP